MRFMAILRRLRHSAAREYLGLSGLAPRIRHADALVMGLWQENQPVSAFCAVPVINGGQGGANHSVIAMARRASRSRADSFSVALLSCPQAARISRPRGVRTGEA